MNFVHLQYALEVAKTGSITQAAENLYMGQPNLSKAIRDLENSLGIKIFERTARGVVATKKGEEFLRHAKNIIDQVNEIEMLYQVQDQDEIELHISIPRASYITYAFTNFVRTLDPEKSLSIHYKETNSIEAIHNIVREEYTLGIIRYQKMYEKYFLNLLAEKEIQYEKLWEFEYVVLMSKTHPLADRETLCGDDLLNYIEVTHGDLAVPSLSMAERNKLEQNARPNRRIYVYERGSQLDLLCHIPETYMWVSPLPEALLERYGLIQRRCEQAQVFNDVLIYSQRHQLHQAELDFVQKLYEVRDDLTKLTIR